MNRSTYVMGTESYMGPLCQHVRSDGRSSVLEYDSRTICLQCMKMKPWYESNWRSLHIDGFEPGYLRPVVHYTFKLGARPVTSFGHVI